jgi:glycosyltransferase involved in cell wall biosynthesis
MKILLVSTLKRAVREDVFASRSRIIFELAAGLAKRGHTVTLLGTGNSEIPGVKVIPVVDKNWDDLPPVENPYLRNMSLLIKQARMMIQLQDEFDIIHNHTYPDFFPHTVEHELHTPLVSTLHALYDKSYMDDTLSLFSKSYFVALSKAYASLYTKTKFFSAVYNGIDTNLYAYSEKKEDYLFWLGRLPLGKNADGTFMDPKGVRWAIQLARKSGQRLYLGGVVEDKKFFEQDVQPYLSNTIRWVGDVSPQQSIPIEQVVSLMQGAKAFLMTVNQFEPFGLVMAEAMSCGTPVIAFDRGSTHEVVADGKTGFVVPYEKGIDGLQDALGKVEQISPRACRDHVDQNFSLERMVQNYEKTYEALIEDYKKSA